METVLILFVVILGCVGFAMQGILAGLDRFVQSRRPRVVFNRVECEHAGREQAGTAANVDCPACSTTHRATLVPYTGKHADDRNAWYFCQVTEDPVAALVSVSVSRLD